jgi:hypothetical protein
VRTLSSRFLTALLLILAAVPVFAAEPQPAPVPIDLEAVLSNPAPAPAVNMSVLPAPTPIFKACPNWVFDSCCPGQSGKQQQHDTCTGKTRCVIGPC